MIRFRHRGEGQSRNLPSLIHILLEGRSERSPHGLIKTADRGFSSLAMIQNLMRSRIGSIITMPDHLLRSNPFVGKPYFRCTRNDE